jgi:formiminoglutamate deiminase
MSGADATGTGSANTASFWCERAWLPGGLAESVVVSCSPEGIVTSVRSGAPPRHAAVQLNGVVFPGFANAHSHAFHRALRGRTHGDGGTFWTWRTQMYRLAHQLDPDRYYELARLVYAEMVLAGYVAVGEFHYLHHPPGGGRYANPNAMGLALVEAARAAGIRLTLLDTCYLTGGLDADGYRPLTDRQQRFGDGGVGQWWARVSALRAELNPVVPTAAEVPLNTNADVRIGAAVHSVRAVPSEALPELAGLVQGMPLHVHLSEQPAENQACQDFHGCSPTELLAGAGLLGPSTTAVHATHVSDNDVRLLGAAGVHACICPSTEADLADGIGPARELADAGCPINVGSDQHAVVDALAEVRALEYGERLRTGQRGRFSPAELIRCGTEHGHRALGWPGAGRIAVGAPCDLVAVRTDTVRTAGVAPEQLVLAGGAPDVRTVVVSGRTIVRDGVHQRVERVGPGLAQEIDRLG